MALHEIAQRFGSANDAPGGATPESIKKFESVVGQPLSSSFTEAWGRHDGLPLDHFQVEDPEYGSIELLSIDQMLDVKQMIKGFEEEGFGEGFEGLAAGGPVQAVYYRPAWIPFACIDETDRYLLLDFDPAEGGAPGQVIYADFQELEARAVVADSLPSYFARLLGN